MLTQTTTGPCGMSSELVIDFRSVFGTSESLKCQACSNNNGYSSADNRASDRMLRNEAEA